LSTCSDPLMSNELYRTQYAICVMWHLMVRSISSDESGENQ